MTETIIAEDKRILSFSNPIPSGPAECPGCTLHGVMNVAIISTFEGEPAHKYVGQKCFACDWRDY